MLVTRHILTNHRFLSFLTQANNRDKYDKTEVSALPPESINTSGAPARKKARSQYRQELTTEQTDDLKEAFKLFDTNMNNYITLQDLRVALRALGFEPAKQEIKRLISKLTNNAQSRDQDKDKEGMVTIDENDFIDIMTTKMSERDSDEQLQKAFILFSQEKDHITFEDLEQIAGELGENMTSAELQTMIDEAESHKSDPTGVVQIDDFMQILRNQQ